MKLIQLTVNRTTVNAILALATLYLVTGCNSGDTAASQTTNDKRVVTLTKDNFQTEVLSSSQPVLVDFWAAWCGPCRMVAPTVAQLATEFEGRAKVGKVDVDAQPDLAKQYDISAIPALKIFKDGNVVEQFVGVRNKSELKEALDKALATSGTQAAAANP
jgi:thioredoxin 1